MSGDRFQKGDVVRKTSGGPPMTVERAGPTAVKCVWFEGTTPHRGEFAPELLEPTAERWTPDPPGAGDGPAG